MILQGPTSEAGCAWTGMVTEAPVEQLDNITAHSHGQQRKTATMRYWRRDTGALGIRDAHDALN
jgi:hypothetical protein